MTDTDLGNGHMPDNRPTPTITYTDDHVVLSWFDGAKWVVIKWDADAAGGVASAIERVIADSAVVETKRPLGAEWPHVRATWWPADGGGVLVSLAAGPTVRKSFIITPMAGAASVVAAIHRAIKQRDCIALHDADVARLPETSDPHDV